MKNTGTETEKRQKIGRGMRLAVDQQGVRQDKELLGTDVHNINKLTVIANESYEEFAKSLQKELKKDLKDRPSKVDVGLFEGRVLQSSSGQKMSLSSKDAQELLYQLRSQEIIDKKGQLTENYLRAGEEVSLSLSEEFAGYETAVQDLLQSVYTEGSYVIESENDTEVVFAKQLNADNYESQEFKKLWAKIHHKSVYMVDFDDQELIEKAVAALNESLQVSKPSYTTYFPHQLEKKFPYLWDF